jgi:hypothetical protein
MYYALFYETAENYVERRKPYREQHLGLARQWHAEGKLLLAGAFNPPEEGALLVFRTESAAEVEEFTKRDPYVLNGLIQRWRVREWTVVIGGDSKK